MIYYIGWINVLRLCAIVTGLFCLGLGWKRGPLGTATKVLLAAVLCMDLLDATSKIVEWFGFTAAFASYEDFLEILWPVLWCFFLYAFLQNTLNAELRRSREQYRELVQSANSIIMRRSPEGRITFVNEYAQRLFGYSAAELMGQNVVGTIVPPADSAQRDLRQMIEEIGRDPDKFAANENENMLRDGTRVWVSWSNKGIRDGDGNVTEILCIGHDVTERKAMERSLRASEERFRTLFNDLTDAVFIHNDPDGRVVEVNEQACRSLGYRREELLGMSPDLFDASENTGELIDQINEQLRRHGRFQLESVHRRKDGSTFPVEISLQTFDFDGRPAHLSTCRDISDRKRAEQERRKLEEQFQQAQKLESLGVLAGGIAHDFNNLLMGVLGNADLAMLEISPVSPARRNLKEVETAARRAAELCRQLLAYSGRGKFVIQRLELNELVREMTHLLEVSISKKVVMVYDFASELPPVEGDPSQLRQVVMNLITNASEAIGDRSGTITIKTRMVHCDRAYLDGTFLDEQLAEGYYVCLEVADTGCGMDAETRDRIFDPFFTTKFTGRGLGLAAVIGIVRGHKGAIKIYSEPGRGTTFKVLLSAVVSQTAQPPAPPLLAAVSAEGLKSKTILLADDESTIRSFTRTVLERAGCNVILAEDGVQAVESLRARPGEIDCVILDLTMPRMGGEEAYRELRRIRPDLRVIVSSGHSEEEVASRFVGKGVSAFIQKPYRTAELLAKLEKALQTNDSDLKGSS